jgi:hypothetical protein
MLIKWMILLYGETGSRLIGPPARIQSFIIFLEVRPRLFGCAPRPRPGRNFSAPRAPCAPAPLPTLRDTNPITRLGPGKTPPYNIQISCFQPTVTPPCLAPSAGPPPARPAPPSPPRPTRAAAPSLVNHVWEPPVKFQRTHGRRDRADGLNASSRRIADPPSGSPAKTRNTPTASPTLPRLAAAAGSRSSTVALPK